MPILIVSRTASARPGMRGLAAATAAAVRSITFMEELLARVERGEKAPEFDARRTLEACAPFQGDPGAFVRAAFEDAKTQWRTWVGTVLHGALICGGLPALPVGFRPDGAAEIEMAEAHAAQCRKAKALRVLIGDLCGLRGAPEFDPAMAEDPPAEPRGQALAGWAKARFAHDAWAGALIRSARFNPTS